MTQYNNNEEDNDDDDLKMYIDDASSLNNHHHHNDDGNIILTNLIKEDEEIQQQKQINKNNNVSFLKESNSNFQSISLEDSTKGELNEGGDRNGNIISKIIYFFKSKPRSLYNTIHCAIGFLFIFFGYSPTQSMLTTLHEDNGSIALGLLYFSFAIGCFIAPLILKKIGIIKSLGLSALTYAIFIYCSITEIKLFEILFLPSAILIGLGAGLLWTSQPVYVSRNAPNEKELGFYSGIFQTIYSMGPIIGNAVSGVMKDRDKETTFSLSILGSVAVSGAIVLFFLKKVDSTIPTPRRSFMKTFSSVFMTFKDRKFIKLLPLFIVQGQSQAYFFETINGLIGISRIGYISVVFSIVSVIGATVWGKLHDKLKNGKRILAIIMGVLYLISLSLSSFAYHFDEIPLFYVISVFNGMFDSLQQILIFTTVAALYPTDNVSQFSASRFVMSVSTGIAFFVFNHLPFYVVIFWILFLLCASEIAFHNLLQEIKTIVKLPNEDDDEVFQSTNKFNHPNNNNPDDFSDISSSFDDRI